MSDLPKIAPRGMMDAMAAVIDTHQRIREQITAHAEEHERIHAERNAKLNAEAPITRGGTYR